ncbi:MAG: nucleoside-diphosphate kinase [Sedimentisphaerales bacterium]|jgi:nucleoside-diphosphate kinase
MADRTLIIIKPDGVQRHLIGEIIGRFEKKGLKLVAAKFLKPDNTIATKLYAVHKGKPFYDGLVKFLCSSPVLAMVWEAPSTGSTHSTGSTSSPQASSGQGQGAIEIARRMLGSTFGYEAVPGTIRGDLGCSRGFNLVHGSDSVQSADYEIPIFFRPEEIVNYEFADEHWLYGKNE